jgi:hypothetical protein
MRNEQQSRLKDESTHIMHLVLAGMQLLQAY